MERPQHSPFLSRRDLTITILKVDLRFYRRSRQSCDISRVPPHFVYHLRLEWSGDTQPRPASPPGSPRSPGRTKSSSDGFRPKSPGGEGMHESPEPFWDCLPRSYTVKRRWHEIVHFHDSLVNDLATDPRTGCARVKAKVPELPGKADIDTWTNAYAATGDACVLSRRKKMEPPAAVGPQGVLAKYAEAPFEDLDGLHWIYVELRLKPYFNMVNKVLGEVPTELLASSQALRRLVLPGSRAAMQKAPCNANGLPRRFLGCQEPVCPGNYEDIEAAVRHLRKTDPAALRSVSVPSLRPPSSPGAAGTSKRRSPSAAAAKLIVSGGTAGSKSESRSPSKARSPSKPGASSGLGATR